MKKFLKEPLLHFLLLGAALFLVSGWIGGDEVESEAKEIVVTKGQILNLAEQFKEVWQRPPTGKELEGLVDNHIREEVLYRQALALGLDENDPMVRRRMSQKLQFISEDIIDQVEPGEADLEEYLKSHADAFRLDSKFTFRQVYFNPDKRGDSLETDIQATQAKLQSAGEAADISEAGDSLMLPADHESVSQGDVARQFGEEFARSLLTVPTGKWHGPVRSGFGVHLVFVGERIDGRLPALDEVRDAVVRDWSAAKRKESNDALYEKWREGYTITIEELSPEKEEESGEWITFAIALVLFALSGVGSADEMRPAYLELRETAEDTYQVIWKVPARGPQQRLALNVRFPADCQIVEPAVANFTGVAFVERSTITREGGLAGAEIYIEGLSRSSTDVLVRVEGLEGNSQIHRLTPAAPSMTITAAPTSFEVAKTYTILGVEHIWAGLDHLLFIGCLLFVAGTWKRILITITGFTVAHSITLALAALEIVQLPIAPVEAVIALSIVFLAVEIARGNENSLTYRYPIAVSASFGLLHGFGFASVLQEIGLPQVEVVTALLFFNVGVEIGQVIFAAVLLVLVWGGLWLWRRQTELNLRSVPARRAAVISSYFIGPIAVFWMIERMIP